MQTDLRCQVYGTCNESLSEDICAKLNIPTKRVYICPRGEFIQVELLDCNEIPADRVGQWQNLDVHHKGRIYGFERILLQTAPVEFGPYGATFHTELSVGVRFVPISRMN